MAKPTQLERNRLMADRATQRQTRIRALLGDGLTRSAAEIAQVLDEPRSTIGLDIRKMKDVKRVGRDYTLKRKRS